MSTRDGAVDGIRWLCEGGGRFILGGRTEYWQVGESPVLLGGFLAVGKYVDA